MERFVLLSRSEEVTPADIPDAIKQALLRRDAQTQIPHREGVGLEAVERDLILEVLRECNWNQSRAARELQITRKTLVYRMAKHGITRATAERARSTAELSAPSTLSR
jgi:two-component system NtrC family response regulator